MTLCKTMNVASRSAALSFAAVSIALPCVAAGVVGAPGFGFANPAVGVDGAQCERHYDFRANLRQVVKTGDSKLKVVALKNPDGTRTAAIVNWGNKRSVSIAGWESFPRSPRFYVYDSARPYSNPFCDLPGPGGVLFPENGGLSVEVPAKGMVFVTTDYRQREVPVVKGVRRTGGRLTWEPIGDPDHCYYRVFRDGCQIASTVANSCRIAEGKVGSYEVVAVDRWGNCGRGGK